MQFPGPIHAKKGGKRKKEGTHVLWKNSYGTKDLVFIVLAVEHYENVSSCENHILIKNNTIQG